VNIIPLVNLAAQHDEVRHEVMVGFEEVMSACSFVQGKQVAAFEEAYAQFIGVQHCVGVANGTDALEIGLRAVGVGPGDEVILPANTFIATAEAVVRAGARPVLVDVDPDGLLMDPAQVLSAMTSRTRAVIPVHLYGQMAPVEGIVDALESAGARVVEDAAQAQGARRNGRAAGSVGSVAGTSFYPGKNLGAYGDAGAVLTDSEDVARQARLIANHGSATRYQHAVVGFNSRLDTLQAVVLSAKLSRLADWNERRRAAAARYSEMLSGLDDLIVPTTLKGNEHVWHLYVVRVPRRDAVLHALQSAGIGSAIHYPVPIHLQPAFEDLGLLAGAFPVSEAAAEAMLSLPLYPHITQAEQEHVVETLIAAMS
jgi:dTDP-4-amino-4,6-dideoxygalactose transaminase